MRDGEGRTPVGEDSERTATFAGVGGVEIFYRVWAAPEERARLVIAHGLGEHSGRYGNVVRRLCPLGLTVWALDHRGHGKSGGARGHVGAFDEYLEDLAAVIRMAEQGDPSGRKCFLLGHSMGGLIALAFAQRFPEAIRGVIASSPGLGTAAEVPAFKVFAARVLSTIWPTFSMGNGLDPSHISRDEAVVEAYRKDPLVHDRVTTRWATEFMAAMERTNGLAASLKVPLLMQVAGDDRLVDPRTAEAFFQRAGSEDKTLRRYEGAFHESYNETEGRRAAALSDLATWLEERA